MEEKNKKIVHFFLLVFAVGIMTFLVPQSIGLGAGGFDSSAILQQFSFYLVGGIFLVLLIVAFIVELVVKRGDERYGSSIAFSSQGDVPHVGFFKRFSSFQLFLLSVIIFGIIFLLITTVRQTSFIGFKTLEQQFTPTAQLLFSSLLVSGSENLGMALVIAGLLIGLRMWARRTNMSKVNFIILSFLVSILGGFYWVLNHLLRYAGQDYQLTVVFVFGFVMALLTLLTGSFIPAWIMHATNNLFFDMQRQFSRDNVVLMVIISLVVLIFFYIIVYRKKKKKPVEVI